MDNQNSRKDGKLKGWDGEEKEWEKKIEEKGWRK